MGNSINMSSSASHIDPNDYHIVGKTNAIRWGEVYEVENNSNGQKAYMQERFTKDYETHQKNIAECSNRLSLSHSNLASLLGFSQNENPDPSDNAYRINLYFEHVVTNLSNLIEMRTSTQGPMQNKSSGKKSTMHYFDESELSRYLNQLVDVLSYLQMNDICLGDITPDVCFLSENGSIKLLDKKLLFKNTSVFELTRQGATNVFPTPGELKALENGYARCAENRYKADLFRLGMTMVECATLRRSADVYDWRTNSIDIETLSSRLIEIKERYSNTFYNTVRELLRFDENKRSDFLMMNNRMQEESALTLDSALPKAEIKSPEASKVKSPFVPKQGEAVERKSSGVKSPFQNDKQASNQKVPFQDPYERGRGKDREEKVRKDETFENDIQELGNNMKVNNVRYLESRSSIDNNSFAGHQSQAEFRNPGNFNIERVQAQGSAKKATPVKAATNENTPSKPKIFGPIKSPEPAQVQQILSPTSRGQEKTKQASIFQSPEAKTEKVEVMYSPFNHRPSNSDITSPPISAQHFNFENLKNFPQLGKYTRSTVSEKSTIDPRASLENTLQSRISPEKVISQNYQSPSKPQIGINKTHLTEPSPPIFSMSSYFSPKTKSDMFNPLEDRRLSAQNQGERLTKAASPIQEVNINRMERLSNKETAPEKYFDAHIPTFGGTEDQGEEQDSRELLDAYKMSFSNRAFIDNLPIEVKEDRKIPTDMLGGQVTIITESSPKSPSFDTRNSLPVFGGQKTNDEPRSFGLSAGNPVLKPTRSSPEKPPILGGENANEKAMKIDDRFERAMQRSKRSEGFVKEMSRSLSKSPLRK